MERHGQKKASNFFILLEIIFAAFFVFIAASFVTQALSFKGKDTIIRWGYIYDLPFQVSDDGALIDQEATVPFKYYTKGVTVMTTTLPDDLPDDAIFCFLSGAASDVYIDGQMRFSSNFKDNPIRGEAVKSILMEVNLSSLDSGKSLTIVRSGDESLKGNIRKAYIGNSLGIYELIFNECGILFYLAITVALAAAAFTFTGIMLWLIRGDHWEIFLIGMAFLLPSLWVICDNNLFQIAFHLHYVEGVLEYILAMLCPLPFFFYLNMQQERRYEKLYCLLTSYDFIMLGILSLLHFSERVSFLESMPFMGSSIVIIVLVGLITIVLDIKRDYEIHYRAFIAGLSILGISSVIDVFMMIVDDNWLDTSAVMIGLIVLFIFTILDIIFNGIRERKETEVAMAANNVKTAFLASLATELAEPVELIADSQCRMLYEDISSENLAYYSAQIKAATGRLKELVGEISQFTTAVPAAMELTEDKYDLDELLEENVAYLKKKAAEAGLKCQVDINPQLPSILWGDAERLGQIFKSLVDKTCNNAGDGLLSLSITMDNYSNASNTMDLVIRVKDCEPVIISQGVIDPSPIGNRHKEEVDTSRHAVILDRKSANEYCMGDDEVYQIMAATFASEAVNRMENLEELMAAQNFREYQITIQGLKKSARQIGAQALYWAAEEMDVACMDKRFDYAMDHHKRLIEIYQATIDAIGE